VRRRLWTRRPVVGRCREITGVCGFQGAPAECIAWTKKTSATPTARGNLLDNPVEDEVPITRRRSLRELDAAMAWQMPDTMLQNTLLYYSAT
jgi:hypothetical protein